MSFIQADATVRNLMEKTGLDMYLNTEGVTEVIINRANENGEHMARRPSGADPVSRLDREPERLALLVPIPRHLVMPTTQRL